MKTNLYCIRDRKSGIFGSPFMHYNDECAVRDFNIVTHSERNRYEGLDFELFKIGEFESTTGEITSFRPDFVASYDYDFDRRYSFLNGGEESDTEKCCCDESTENTL